MQTTLRAHAESILQASLAAVQPDAAVRRALSAQSFPGPVTLIAAGKAAWPMAKAAYESPNVRIKRGIVLTKYGHAQGPLGPIVCCEGGHPVPDENSFANTERALRLVENLTAGDTVLFLLSGGGSALFEKPLLPVSQLQAITGQRGHCGDEHHPQAAVRRKGGPVCPAVRTGPGFFGGSLRHTGGPAGYDCLRPCCA